ncbi:hypothetical protein BGW39_011284 [Mortierella sp. 14UC]|nr:hypothetical protein BGW39_011284 [Mortierella sp. 14UC]
MDYQQREQWTQYQGNATTSSGTANSIPSPNPPVLSFRAFHATHFSWSQRQAFFAGSAPAPWAHSYPSFAHPHPVETDTLAGPPLSERDSSHQDNAQTFATDDAKATSQHYDNTTVVASAAAAAAENEGAGETALGLTQEAIEIFEFSRRFREEKAAALVLERARMARRRTKRRRLTRRGFAPDEGNSGSDDAPEAEQDDNSKRDDSDDGGSESEDGDDGGEEGDNDEFLLQMESPATDTAFLTQASRQRERTRQRLYGLLKKSDSKDMDSPSVSSSTSTSTSTSTQDDLWSIQMLEALLNQTFVDSLGPANSSLPNAAVPGNIRRRTRDSGRGAKGAAKSRSFQQSQVVYWPGMPMRC